MVEGFGGLAQPLVDQAADDEHNYRYREEMGELFRHWQLYHRQEWSTVVGDLRVLHDVQSPQLNNRRDLIACLPPSYHDTDRCYPVLYLQDGQNLFDSATSYSGEWYVDETVLALAPEGYEAVVVGIPNAGEQRTAEYLPDQRGKQYVEFLTDTVKPIVDASFRTLTGRTDTGLGGSSLGGMISMYGLFARSDVFGFAAVMSPAFALAQESIMGFVADATTVPARIWLDVGDSEFEPGVSSTYVDSVARMHALLRSKGYSDHDLRYVVDRGARHEEAAWAHRLPDALRFLLPRS
jgi:predicted alpha/beta superfamily hydrolase